MIATVITTIGGLVSDWLSHKREEKTETHKAKMRTIANRQEWDLAQAENAKTSWKDEWFVILLSMPLIGAFTGFEGEIARGFQVLDSMPDYYKAFLAAAVAASFGFKALTNVWRK